MAKLIPGENDLSTTHPEVAAEWHPSKNGELTPEQVTGGSERKVWWLGKCGHEWQASIYNRAHIKSSCPICAGKQVLPGYNDLATTNPELAAEWHPTKNGKLMPSDVTQGSSKKVWWQCERGHEWQATVSNRSAGRGCPYCAKFRGKVLKGFNDFATIHPELAAEWHPTKNGNLTPSDVTQGSGKKVWWQCSEGHEWQAGMNERNRNRNCPYCSGKRVLPGYNDLATVRPELAAEWHPTKNGELTPTQVTPGAKLKVWWQCSEGHEWKAVINNRVNGCNCPICAGKQVLPGYNDLTTIRPKLAAEWHPTKNGELTPEQITAGSNKKVWWKCVKGHEWQATVASRSSGIGCPACSAETFTSFPEQVIFYYLNQLSPAENRYMLNGDTEIDVFLPEYKFGVEYDGHRHTNKQKDIRKSHICEQNGIRLIRVRVPGLPILPVECIVLQSLADSVLEETIKQICDILGKTVDINIDRDRAQIYEQYIENEKANSIAVKNPELIAEWHPTKNGDLTPEHVTPGSDKTVWWQCSKGHEWQAKIHTRSRGHGCIYCCNQKVLLGYNDLATIHPNAAAEWHPTKNGDLTPGQVLSCSGKRFWWKCSVCGHEWQSRAADRDRGHNCPACAEVARRKSRINTLLIKNGSFAFVHPELAAEWHPTKNGELTPEQVTYASHKKVWWQCAVCGHEWETRVAERHRGRGCPVCAGKKLKYVE